MEAFIKQMSEVTGIDPLKIQEIYQKVEQWVNNPTISKESEAINNEFKTKIRGLFDQRTKRPDAYLQHINY